jgi:oligopeptide/dipeptide ABC transporter ATP-binding protein
MSGPLRAADRKLLELVGIGKTFELRGSILARLRGRQNVLHAVRDVSLDIMTGEIVGLVGESGSGKSTLGRMIVSLIPPSDGSILYRNKEVTHLQRGDLAAYRRQTQMVFQDSTSSLNPRKRIGVLLKQALAARGVARRQRDEEAARLLSLCGLAPFVLDRYPHELSGGQRQRVGIARALAMQPDLLVADEPVSALDVSLQGQIINLLTRLSRELGLALIFISHDLAVVQRISARVGVMYAGRIVELGPPHLLKTAPAHPYTQTLIDAVPRGLAGRTRTRPVSRGEDADPGQAHAGCAFRQRCGHAIAVCTTVDPVFSRIGTDHFVACHLRAKTLDEAIA